MVLNESDVPIQPSGFSCSSYYSLFPSWVPLGHLLDLWFGEGLVVSNAEGMGHSAKLSAIRVNPGIDLNNPPKVA